MSADPFAARGNGFRKEDLFDFRKVPPRGGAAAGKNREEARDRLWEAEAAAFADQEARKGLRTGPAAQSISVKVFHARWDRETAKTHETVTASVDVDLPSGQPRTGCIEFVLYRLLPDGNRPRVESKHADVKDGKSLCPFTLPPLSAGPDGKVPDKGYFQFTARHAHSDEVQSSRLEAVPGPPVAGFESYIFFSPSRNEYVVFETEEEFKSLQLEIEELDGLQGKTRQAFEKADPTERNRALEDVAGKTDALFGGRPVVNAKGVFEELLLVRKYEPWGKTKSWIYIRSYSRQDGSRVKGHARKETDARLKKNLEELLKKAPGNKEASPLLTTKLKLNLFKVDPYEKRFPLAWAWEDGVKKEGKIAGQTFSFTKEGATCRFAMGWDGVEGAVNLQDKKIRLGTSGHVSYGLFEGKMEGEIYCPEKGINLLEHLEKVPHLHNFLDEGRKCLLRLKVGLSAQAFAGLSLKGSLAFPNVDLSQEKLAKGKTPAAKGSRVNTSGDSDGLLGAQVTEGLSVSPEWSPTDGKSFSALGRGGVEVGGSAGLAGTAKCKLEYVNGKFRLKVGAALALGVGPRGGFQIDIDVKEGWKFVGHLLHAIDYHKAGEITAEAFRAYADHAFTLLTQGEKALIKGVEATEEAIGDFRGWLSNLDNRLNEIKRNLSECSAYSATLSRVPPEALGQALLTVMKTRKQDDFQTILRILNSTVRPGADCKKDASANHKLVCTMRQISMSSPPGDRYFTAPTQKNEALRMGINKITHFAEGIGYVDEKGRQPRSDEPFFTEFRELLNRNGVI